MHGGRSAVDEREGEEGFRGEPMRRRLFAREAPRPELVEDEVQRAHLRRYHHLRNDCPEEVEYLESLWGTYEGLGIADPNFSESFPHECGARIWEMRLACTLHGWGWDLLAATASQDGPDFGVRFENGTVVWVEACTPTDGAETLDGRRNPDKVRAGFGQFIWGKETDRTLFLRLMNSIHKKRKQRQGWLRAGVVQEDEGFVVALSGAMLSLALTEREDAPPRIVRCLFGVGEPQFALTTNDEVVRDGFATQRSVARKSGTEQAWTNLFCDSYAPDVSGVLYAGSYRRSGPRSTVTPQGATTSSSTVRLRRRPCRRSPFHVRVFRAAASGTRTRPRTNRATFCWTGTVVGCHRCARPACGDWRTAGWQCHSPRRLVRSTFKTTTTTTIDELPFPDPLHARRRGAADPRAVPARPGRVAVSSPRRPSPPAPRPASRPARTRRSGSRGA